MEEIISRVNKMWDAYIKSNPKMVAPMLKGMPKKAKPYFIKFFKSNTYGYVENDLNYCKKVLSLMGIPAEDARVFFECEIKGNY